MRGRKPILSVDGHPTFLKRKGRQQDSYLRLTCQICGKLFDIRLDRYRKGLGKGCSRSCRVLIGIGRTKRERRSTKYVMLYMPDHPRASKGKSPSCRGWVCEHILVAEQTLARSLRTGEVVHHINGNKRDNRPENLEVLIAREHNKLHLTRGYLPCRFCGKI